ncbi:Hypothetical predicted protein [Octopus vulgaris]|uniref:Vesicular, overexpressed in cancer, prosurvival protein 1 n=1 Tax=Octopus vulgaris TaxID=6645 RepID=A0AA36FFD2_OCTVU|nr:Hypothetical predicted protein [Octopus vulgaris]
MAVRLPLLTLALFGILHPLQVAGYYCDSDKCGDDEYCCGYNICCKSYKVWELWFGFGIILILLFFFGCFWKYRQNRNYLIIRTDIPYTTIHSHGAMNATLPDSCKPGYPKDGQYYNVQVPHQFSSTKAQHLQYPKANDYFQR